MAVGAEGGEGVCEWETGVLAMMGCVFIWGVGGVAEGVCEGVLGMVGRVLVRGVGVAGFLFPLFVGFVDFARLTVSWPFVDFGTNVTPLH